MPGMKELWDWAKSAPLPVVLALNLVIAGWVYSLDEKQTEQDKKQAVGEQAAKDTKDAVEKANDKLDKLLQAVADLKAAAEARDKAEKAKEKKK